MDAKNILLRARNEVLEENVKKAVELYKRKLRERDAAAAVLANIDREVKELEIKIEQGNI